MSSELRILFTGDLSITGVFRQRVERGDEIFDAAILEQFAAHDFTVTNLEGPTTRAENLAKSPIAVVSPPETVHYLVSRGVAVFNLANNHMFDCGLPGFVDTVRAIEQAGGEYFGAGTDVTAASRSLVLEAAGTKVALVGICGHRGAIATENDCGTFYDSQSATVKSALTTARSLADFVVLNYHAGEEYTTVPMPSRRRKMLKYASYGPDLLIGHHSHVFQGRERAHGREVYYSLGNFVFDHAHQRLQQFTNVGALVSVTFRESNVSCDLIPIEIDYANGKVVAGRSDFLQHVAGISEFENYSRLWRRDAYRTFFHSRHSIGEQQAAPIPAGSNRTKRLPLILNPRWYTKQIQRLRNPNLRPIMLGAYSEALRRLFRK